MLSRTSVVRLATASFGLSLSMPRCRWRRPFDRLRANGQLNGTVSRTADHPFWMARYKERAGQVAQRLAAQPQHGGARERVAGFSAREELNDAL